MVQGPRTDEGGGGGGRSVRHGGLLPQQLEQEGALHGVQHARKLVHVL
jgi:hypothetical protein